MSVAPHFDLQAKFIPLPYTMCVGFRHPPPSTHPPPHTPQEHMLHMEAAPVMLLADIWKCFGPVLEVTVWTNRDHTSTCAKWQAFIYLRGLVYCMETPQPPFYPLLSVLSAHFLPPTSSVPNPTPTTTTFFFPLDLHSDPIMLVQIRESRSNHWVSFTWRMRPLWCGGFMCFCFLFRIVASLWIITQN